MGGESNYNRAVVYTDPGTTKTEVVELPIPKPDRCLQGGESSCAEVKLSGYFTPGTFQQYCISTARYVTPVPDSLDSAQAAPLMCGGLTVHTALKRAKARHGDWVVIAGAGGGLGHLAIQYARTLGCRILAMDRGAKEKFCRDLGADEFVDFTTYPDEEDLAATVKRMTGGGARIVLMCSSNKKAYVQSPNWLGFRGKLVCLGVPECNSVSIADVESILVDELTIFGVKTGNRLEAKECLEIAARGNVKTHFQLRRMKSLTKNIHRYCYEAL
ncbi:alcohol dehydrogenase [Colletotrichum tofieldiae]|nr:alcohol dehydrogenase [Colletotrichum tofieldiae]